MAILSRELASDHRLHNSLPSSTPMGASRFLLLQGPSQRRRLVQPLHPCMAQSWECPLLTCFYHKFLHVGAIILVKLQKSLWEKTAVDNLQVFLPPSLIPYKPCFKNQTQEQFTATVLTGLCMYLVQTNKNMCILFHRAYINLTELESQNRNTLANKYIWGWKIKIYT